MHNLSWIWIFTKKNYLQNIRWPYCNWRWWYWKNSLHFAWWKSCGNKCSTTDACSRDFVSSWYYRLRVWRCTWSTCIQYNEIRFGLEKNILPKHCFKWWKHFIQRFEFMKWLKGLKSTLKLFDFRFWRSTFEWSEKNGTKRFKN